MTPIQEALDIAERLTKYTYYKSMTQLRKRIKTELKNCGLQDQLRNFKIYSATGTDEVIVCIRPGVSYFTDLFMNQDE